MPGKGIVEVLVTPRNRAGGRGRVRGSLPRADRLSVARALRGRVRGGSPSGVGRVQARRTTHLIGLGCAIVRIEVTH